MIRTIYSHNFYSLITPPNKEDLLSKLKNIQKTKNQYFSWKTGCDVETERLDKNQISDLITPSLHLFLRDLDLKKTVDVELVDVWKNVYRKGCFQEIHDHIEDCDFSSVLFMDDQEKDFARFFFYNRNITELSSNWRKILFPYGHNYVIDHKKGDILFFPSHMLHGVMQHKSNKPRTTVTFNFKFMF